jgi:hypothetical protein
MKTQKFFMSLIVGLGAIALSTQSHSAQAGEVDTRTNTICSCVESGGGANCGTLPGASSSGQAPAGGQTTHTGNQ